MKMLINMKSLLLVGLMCVTMQLEALADWTSFRDGGQSQASTELPLAWSPDNGIAWQRELPGYGQSTPVILGDKVFVTAVVGTMKEQCRVLCLEMETGNELWQCRFESSNPSPSNYMASRAAPTPTVDSQAVYAFF